MTDKRSNFPDNLRSCPACGDVACIDETKRGNMVWCTKCGLTLEGRLDYESMVELWNRMQTEAGVQLTYPRQSSKLAA